MIAHGTERPGSRYVHRKTIENTLIRDNIQLEQRQKFTEEVVAEYWCDHCKGWVRSQGFGILGHIACHMCNRTWED